MYVEDMDTLACGGAEQDSLPLGFCKGLKQLPTFSDYLQMFHPSEKSVAPLASSVLFEKIDRPKLP